MNPPRWPHRPARFGAFAWLALWFATGCATTASHRALTDRVDANEARLVALEAGVESERAELQRRLAETHEVLEQAERVLRRNSADHGLRIDELAQQVASTRGEAAEAMNAADTSARAVEAVRAEIREHRSTVDDERARVARRLDEIARAAGMDAPARAEDIPADADAHYRAAELALRSGAHSQARALLRAFIERYPAEARADDAQHLLGVSYRRQGQPAAALAELRRVITTYRTGDAVDRALLEMAEAFVQLGACGDARDSLRALVSTQPRSRLVPRARARTRELTDDVCASP